MKKEWSHDGFSANSDSSGLKITVYLANF